METAEVRFWAKVRKTGGCWLWRGAASKRTGYGHFGITSSIRVSAHRFAYQLVAKRAA